jgi:hypothetical protein
LKLLRKKTKVSTINLTSRFHFTEAISHWPYQLQFQIKNNFQVLFIMQTVCGSHLARNKIKQPHVDAFHGPVLGFCILLFHFKIRQQWYWRICSIRTQLSSTQRALAPPSLRVSSPPGCSTTRRLSTWTPCHPLPQICWQGQG